MPRVLHSRNNASRATRFSRLYGIASVVVLGMSACLSPPLETPVQLGACTQRLPIQQNIRNKVDILFMVDNSNSMEAMSTKLRANFSQFFKPFIDLAAIQSTYADLHVGVVTSDYGAGASGAPGCSPSPGGQQGRLQARGAKADAACKSPVQANYIQYAFGEGGGDGVNNLPAGQDLLTTFTCMASVGSSGCGFEHQLESVYAALHNNLPDNVGFLRDDALLVVVFLTNEDDASAPPDSDVFDKNKSGLRYSWNGTDEGPYGYEDSYNRQTRFAVMCCPPGMASCSPAQRQFPPDGPSGGPLKDCIAAPNLPTGAGPGKMYDISRYVDLFTKPMAQGGVKRNPLDVVLVGIDAPAAPFNVVLSNPGTTPGQPFVECAQQNGMSNPPCVPVLQHSCRNDAQPELFGDPSVRLNAVIGSVQQSVIAPICDNDYSAVLTTTASLIVSNIKGGCIPQRLPESADHPSCATNADCGMNEICGLDPMSAAKALTCLKADCSVVDVTYNADGTASTVEVPACPQGGKNPGTTPCWRIELKDVNVCGMGQSPNHVGLVVDRAGQLAPPHTTANVSCAFKC